MIIIIKNIIVCFIFVYLFFVVIYCKNFKVDIDSKYGGDNRYLNNDYNHIHNNNNDNNNLYIIKENKKCTLITSTIEKEEEESSIKKFGDTVLNKMFGFISKSKECQFKKEKDELQKSINEYFSDKYITCQDEQLKELKSIIIRKYRNPESKAVIHLFGDHGVGKTKSSILFSRILFENVNDNNDGLFIINGQDFSFLDYNIESSNSNDNNSNNKNKNNLYQSQTIQKLRNNLYNTVLNQLEKCPYSVIVLDEIQKIHPDILCVLEPVFDGTELLWYNSGNGNDNNNDNDSGNNNNNNNIDDLDNIQLKKGKKVKTSLATYILTSDFGIEGFTRRKSNQELKEIASKLFKIIYNDNKFSKLVTDSIPFGPLTEDNVHQAITQQIVNLFCGDKYLDALNIQDIEKVLSIISTGMNSLYSNENFRGIEKILNKYIFDKVSAFQLLEYDNILIQFKNQLKNNNQHDNIDKDNNKKIIFTLYIKPNQFNNNLDIKILPSLIST